MLSAINLSNKKNFTVFPLVAMATRILNCDHIGIKSKENIYLNRLYRKELSE